MIICQVVSRSVHALMITYHLDALDESALELPFSVITQIIVYLR